MIDKMIDNKIKQLKKLMRSKVESADDRGIINNLNNEYKHLSHAYTRFCENHPELSDNLYYNSTFRSNREINDSTPMITHNANVITINPLDLETMELQGKNVEKLKVAKEQIDVVINQLFEAESRIVTNISNLVTRVLAIIAIVISIIAIFK